MKPGKRFPLSPRRLWALCRKESYQILRDPSSILIAFIMPVLLLFVMGYAVNLDVDHLRVGLLRPRSGLRRCGVVALRPLRRRRGALRGRLLLRRPDLPRRRVVDVRPRLRRRAALRRLVLRRGAALRRGALELCRRLHRLGAHQLRRRLLRRCSGVPRRRRLAVRLRPCRRGGRPDRVW